MPDYRRYYIHNSLVFITCVTHNRIKILADEKYLSIFWSVLKKAQLLHPFHLFAYVIMPDHFHWIMQLPEENPNFSEPMHSIKRNLTWEFKKELGVNQFQLWQRGFWDHVIRDDEDLKQHFDYIHWNPVKHGYVNDPIDWGASSFEFWYQKGNYEKGWGCKDKPPSLDLSDLE